MPFLGELSALATAVFWSGTAMVFAAASKRVGSLRVNITRLVFAFVMLVATIAVFRIDVQLSSRQVYLLAVSGFIGLVFGDGFLFRAFKDVGPRVSMLIMALAPAFAAGLAYLFLGEHLAPSGVAGMLITIAGIALVVLEKKSGSESLSHIHWIGILFAFFGAVGQAGGLIFAKMAFNESDIHGMVATSVRIVAALAFFLPLAPFLKSVRHPVRIFGNDRRALSLTLLGSVLGPYCGITFSLVAIAHTEVGIAATIMALPPIIMLPMVWYFYKERLTLRAVVGAVIAVGGVAVLFLR